MNPTIHEFCWISYNETLEVFRLFYTISTNGKEVNETWEKRVNVIDWENFEKEGMRRNSFKMGTSSGR